MNIKLARANAMFGEMQDAAPSLRDSGYFRGTVFPTLKRGANKHCAYGAGVVEMPGRWVSLKESAPSAAKAARILGFYIRAEARTLQSDPLPDGGAGLIFIFKSRDKK